MTFRAVRVVAVLVLACTGLALLLWFSGVLWYSPGGNRDFVDPEDLPDLSVAAFYMQDLVAIVAMGTHEVQYLDIGQETAQETIWSPGLRMAVALGLSDTSFELRTVSQEGVETTEVVLPGRAVPLNSDTVTRSLPAFSPDGALFAWAFADQSTGTISVLLLDTNTRKHKVIATYIEKTDFMEGPVWANAEEFAILSGSKGNHAYFVDIFSSPHEAHKRKRYEVDGETLGVESPTDIWDFDLVATGDSYLLYIHALVWESYPIYRLYPDGTVTPFTIEGIVRGLSPDGETASFEGDSDDWHPLFRIDDGLNVIHPLLEAAGYSDYGTWDESGRYYAATMENGFGLPALLHPIMTGATIMVHDLETSTLIARRQVINHLRVPIELFLIPNTPPETLIARISALVGDEVKVISGEEMEQLTTKWWETL